MINSSIAVIVTTYNRPKALCWVLSGLAHQTLKPDLIVVADDGSQDSTRTAIDRIRLNWQTIGSLPKLVHVWQADEGFRAARIRNRAVAHCLSNESQRPDLLIFIDGDCIPLPSFVAHHSKLIGTPDQRLTIAGGRTLFSEELTYQLEQESETEIFSNYSKRFLVLQLLKWRIQGRLNRILPLLNLPISSLRSSSPLKWQSFRTCNVSLWTSDLIAVNGFNEDFVGWGFEDSDLAIRLIRAGIRVKSGRFATNVLHLWHPESSRSNIENNKALLKNSWSNDIKVPEGLDKHIAVNLWD